MGRNLIFFRRTLLQTFWSILLLKKCESDLTWASRIKVKGKRGNTTTVPDPGKGLCADPVNGGAILGKGGSDPQGGNKERQLSPDKGRDET
jgi:hypothetical protein